ncbi:acyltransferase family protein [Hymenobacter sediminicola]|uniref:acyltransferase family protein n=1 Tax=Hymenobacter sediminicola TaxID=2761579 RepID=UPI0021AE3E76|nr:acyltransferase family protein [Hymenobacter sediminicola]
MWCHCIENRYLLDPGYVPQSVLAFLPPSHLAVLLFFVLSGYVIGRSTPPLTGRADIREYLKKRIIRIYPIYLLAMVLAIVIAGPYPLTTILGNLSLTQVLLTDVIRENGASWSLHYEVIYYLLFIPISYYRLPVVPVLAGFLAVGLGNMALNPATPLPSSYALGFVFWLAGLWLSDYRRTAAKVSLAPRQLVGGLLFLLSLHYFNVLDMGLRKVLLDFCGEWWRFDRALDPFATQIRPMDFAFLPYALCFVLCFAGIDFRFRRPILLFLLLAPALTFVHLATHIEEVYLAPNLVAGGFYLSGLWLMLGRNTLADAASTRVLHRLAGLGGISYGVYIIHGPVLHMFQWVEWFSGTPLTFLVRFALLVAVVLTAGYALEKQFHPWVRRRLGLAEGSSALPASARTI